MSTATLARLRPSRETAVFWAAIVNAELLVVLAYFALVTGPPDSPRFLALVAVPWVWLNVSWWVYRTVEPSVAPLAHRSVAALVAAGYFILLGYVGGLVVPGIGDLATGLRIVTYQVPPGFAPAVLYSGDTVVVNFIPYQVAGYLALSYLVYVTIVDLSGSAAAGLVGLFSCVSCSVPLLAAFVSGVTGSATFAATVGQGSYGLSTIVFVVSVLLLRWRPGLAELNRVRAWLR